MHRTVEATPPNISQHPPLGLHHLASSIHPQAGPADISLQDLEVRIKAFDGELHLFDDILSWHERASDGCMPQSAAIFQKKMMIKVIHIMQVCGCPNDHFNWWTEPKFEDTMCL